MKLLCWMAIVEYEQEILVFVSLPFREQTMTRQSWTGFLDFSTGRMSRSSARFNWFLANSLLKLTFKITPGSRNDWIYIDQTFWTFASVVRILKQTFIEKVVWHYVSRKKIHLFRNSFCKVFPYLKCMIIYFNQLVWEKWKGMNPCYKSS